MAKIGVFDSGVGGRSVANAIQRAMPEHKVLYRQDKQNIPYGSKRISQLKKFVTPIVLDMERDGCDVIVIACNTVSTTIIQDLREVVSVPLIAVEPMIEQAALVTKSGVITVCATPRTLKSERYKHLRNTYASDLKVLQPDCSEWASMIERQAVDRAHIRDTIRDSLAAGSDVIVLGCTHYHWIEEIIERIVGEKAAILQPEQDAIIELQEVLAQLR